MSRLNPEERLKIQQDLNRAPIYSQEDRISDPFTQLELANCDRERIVKELRELAREIGSLPFEEGLWVLFPKDSEQSAYWIEAGDSMGWVSRKLCSRPWWSRTVYRFSDEQRHLLVALMHSASVVLHIHNHPDFPDVKARPSNGDVRFAYYWRSITPLAISERTRFFTIKGRTVFEYALSRNGVERWSI